MQLAIFLAIPAPLDRIILGTSLYLIYAAAGIMLGWTELLEQFKIYEEVGVLAYILIANITAFALTPSRCLATANHSDRTKIFQYSTVVCVAAFIALIVSFTFKGQYLFSAVIPIFSLIFLNKYFVRKLDKA